MFKCGHLSGSIRVTDGGAKVVPCCHIDVTQYDSKRFVSSNLSPTIDQLLNHELLVEMREAAIADTPHPLCNKCIRQEARGLRSARQNSFKDFNNNGEVKKTIDRNDIELLYLTLSNVCNFKCVMCNANDSHLIAKELQRPNPLLDIGETYFDSVIELIQSSPNLNAVQMSGGEPFYNKKRLNQIIQSTPHDAYIYMHTNGSIFDEEIQTIVKQLEQFRKSNVIFSIDGTDKVFEYQRVNGKWSDVLNNIKTFNRVIDTDKVYITNNYTVTCFTLLDIIRYIKIVSKYFHGTNFEPIVNPEIFRINLIKEKYLIDFLNDIEQYMDIDTLRLTKVYDAADSALSNPPSQKTVDKLWKNIEYNHRVRGVNLKQMIPNAYKYLKR